MSSDISLDIVSSDDRIFDAVRQLLKTWTLNKYLARKPPCSVVTLSSNSTCGHALRALALHSISSAPVFDGSVCLGFLDVSDIVRALLDIVDVRELTDENKEYQLRSAGKLQCLLQLASAFSAEVASVTRPVQARVGRCCWP